MVVFVGAIILKQRRASQTEQQRLTVRKTQIVVFRCPENLSDSRELKRFIRTALAMMMVPM